MAGARDGRRRKGARLLLAAFAMLGVLSLASSEALHDHGHDRACGEGPRLSALHETASCPACGLVHVMGVDPRPAVASSGAELAGTLVSCAGDPPRAHLVRSIRPRAPPELS